MPRQNEQDENIAFVRRGKTRKEVPATEAAKPFVEYAILCAVVYDHPMDSDRVADTKFLNDQGWTQWNDVPPIPPADDWRYEIKGLSYEVWEKLEADRVTVAIVFRGTDDAVDWWTNFRWVTRYVPFTRDQYMQTQDLTPLLVKKVYERHQGKDIRIVTAGHSLGGGLAHQAAYVSDRIKNVFAFNSSPVTGFHSVSDPPRSHNVKGIVVDRIFEHGEFLAFLRRAVRVVVPLTTENPEIIETRFNFSKGNAIIEHGMRALAHKLKTKANESET